MSNRRPIILIGAARSGTKFLRDIIASDKSVKAVPFDANFVWRYGVEEESDDALSITGVTENKKNYIRNTLLNIAKCGPEDRLLEKTVSNTLRVAYVDKIFPNAVYIHLVRNGIDVVESAMRQWKKEPDLIESIRKLKQFPISNIDYLIWYFKNYLSGKLVGRGGGAIWGPRIPQFSKIAEEESLAYICALQWATCVNTANIDLKRIKDYSSRVILVKYEDLMRNDNEIERLVSWLELTNKDQVVDEFKSRRITDCGKKWQQLPDSDINLINDICARVSV